MTMVRIIDIKQSVFADNDADAARLRQQLNARGVFLVNLMSSPGAGKTSVLRRTIDALKDEFRIGVMEADIESAVDAETLSERGVDVIQLHTGGMCHLDADMTRQGLTELGVFGG
ncbi:MAG: hydrogenase accessory protein HypB, partial [Firmicutes bacterium]|nr:hydrogenase accessory protein HypB [Bacillota bacterium]